MRLVPQDPVVRRLALGTLVNTSGRGIYFTLSALYFTRIVGFSVVQVGTALSVAAGVALFAAIPIGHLADRRGAREVQIALLVVITGLSGLLLLVTAWWQFVVLATLLAIVDRGSGAVRQGLIAGLLPRSARSGTKAYLRSITNVGMTLGTAIAAIALHFDTREAYLWVLYIDVATYAVCTLPHVRPTPAKHAVGMFHALRDLPFVALTLVTSVLAVHYWIVEIAMPLWVVNETDAPKALVAVLAIVNTVIVVACQVAVARRVDSMTAAARATVLSGVLFLLTCLAFGLSAGAGVAVAVACLVAAALLQVGGELLQSSASFFVGFELPPDHAQGQYQGVWSLGFGIASFSAPLLIALLPLGLGVPGWWILGALLLAAALVFVPTLRWAERTRDRYATRVPVDA
jgi:MFS family permease